MSQRHNTSAEGKDPLTQISTQNSEFWDEMCGSIAFRNLGLNEVSTTSLETFDRWYFDTYPYLIPWLEPLVAGAEDVVEIGLGFGSIGQFIATKALNYTGVDIAHGPVALMNYRLEAHGLQGRSLVANVLSLPFATNSQDLVVAIGSLHHVGDFEGAVAEITRVLRPGGRFCGMVYGAYSIRTLFREPSAMFSALANSVTKPGRFSDSDRLRAAADTDSRGNPAPFTEFFSRRALRDCLATDFSKIRTVRRNANGQRFGGKRLRQFLLSAPLRPLLSLDLYFTASMRS